MHFSFCRLKHLQYVEYLLLDMIIWKFLVSHEIETAVPYLLGKLVSCCYICCLVCDQEIHLGKLLGRRLEFSRFYHNYFPQTVVLQHRTELNCLVILQPIFLSCLVPCHLLLTERSSSLYCSTDRRGNVFSETKSFGIGCMFSYLINISFLFPAALFLL